LVKKQRDEDRNQNHPEDCQKVGNSNDAGRHFSLRPSAYLCVLCVNGRFNAENAEIRRGPQRKNSISYYEVLTKRFQAGIRT
jgi:hypothetical protein